MGLVINNFTFAAMEVLERFLDYLKLSDESEDESVSGKNSGIPDNKVQAKKKNPNKKQFPPPPSAGESDTDEVSLFEI